MSEPPVNLFRYIDAETLAGDLSYAGTWGPQLGILARDVGTLARDLCIIETVLSRVRSRLRVAPLELVGAKLSVMTRLMTCLLRRGTFAASPVANIDNAGLESSNEVVGRSNQVQDAPLRLMASLAFVLVFPTDGRWSVRYASVARMSVHGPGHLHWHFSTARSAPLDIPGGGHGATRLPA